MFRVRLCREVYPELIFTSTPRVQEFLKSIKRKWQPGTVHKQLKEMTMKLFINIHDNFIFIKARVEGPGSIADHSRRIEKGETFYFGDLSIPYDTFIAHGDGLFDTEKEK